MDIKEILSQAADFGPGAAAYYKNLKTGEEQAVNASQPLMAASVIKLPIMAAAFGMFASGDADPKERYTLREEDKLPSCGILNCLDAGHSFTLPELVTMMIVLSDNSATNILIKRLGTDRLNESFKAMGLSETRLNRLLFDADAASRGLENYVSCRDMALILEKIYQAQLVSEEASRRMLDILSNQKLNGKIPFWLDREGIRSAHKTGEDTGITNDVGIVFAHEPFILCMLSNVRDTGRFDRLIQDTAGKLAKVI